MRAEVRIEIVPGASHLFEEPGALEQVAALAARWFEDHLPPRTPPERREISARARTQPVRKEDAAVVSLSVRSGADG